MLGTAALATAPKHHKTHQNGVQRRCEGRQHVSHACLSPSFPVVPHTHTAKASEKSLSVNPLGSEGAEAKSWLSASNIGRGGGGGGPVRTNEAQAWPLNRGRLNPSHTLCPAQHSLTSTSEPRSWSSFSSPPSDHGSSTCTPQRTGGGGGTGRSGSRAPGRPCRCAPRPLGLGARWCGHRPRGREVLEGNGPQRPPQQRLDRRLEEVAKAVGGGYCRLQMPLRLALGIRRTVAGHRLGAQEAGGGNLPLFQCIPAEGCAVPPRPLCQGMGRLRGDRDSGAARTQHRPDNRRPRGRKGLQSHAVCGVWRAPYLHRHGPSPCLPQNAASRTCPPPFGDPQKCGQENARGPGSLACLVLSSCHIPAHKWSVRQVGRSRTRQTRRGFVRGGGGGGDHRSWSSRFAGWCFWWVEGGGGATAELVLPGVRMGLSSE